VGSPRRNRHVPEKRTRNVVASSRRKEIRPSVAIGLLGLRLSVAYLRAQAFI
jgi:hypothetical protein